MKKLRAVFVEEDSSLAEELKPHYLRFFQDCGYEAEFFDAENEGKARKVIDTCDPHVIVCDLGFDKEFSGLYLIRALRMAYPDLFIIGTSRGSYSNKDIDRRQPSFHMFIDKQELLGGKPEYIKVAKERFLDRFKIETTVSIANIDDFRSNLFKKGTEKRELLALIRQVTFSGHKPDDLMHPDQVTLEPLSGGFSGSEVFKMLSRNSKSGIMSVPSVVKISKKEFAEQELENYNRFVKWGLPYTWRVDLLGFGAAKSYGAIAYSFILSDLKKFEPLTELVRRKEDSRALEVIRTLFSPEMRRWYGDPLIRKENNLVERYNNRFFRGAESKATSERVFDATAQTLFGAHMSASKIKIGHAFFGLPAPTLFGLPMSEYHSCICHGDLNGNNVMVAENSQIIFIDFQETGRGHVFEDFVTMEASVRLYHGEESLHGVELLAAEEAIRDGSDVGALSGPQRIAADIRQLAKKNFPSEPFENYYFASAMFNFRLLRIEQLSPSQRGRVVAAILAGLADLARMRGKRSSRSVLSDIDTATGNLS